MPLQSQDLPIPFVNGIDTKDDPKQLNPGQFIYLKNASFRSPKQIKKRDGFTALSSSISGSTTITNGLGVQAYRDELIELDGTSLYSYSDTLSKWVNKGACKLTSLSAQTIVRNTYAQTAPSVAYHAASNLSCYVWSDSSNTVSYSIVDNTEGILLVSTGTVSSQGIAPVKVATLGSNFVIVYFDAIANALKYKSVAVATPTTLSSATTIASDIYAALPVFDISLIGTQLVIAYNRSASIAMYSLSSGLVLSSQHVQASTSTCESICVFGDTSNNAWVGYGHISGGSTLYKYFITDSTLTSILSVTALGTSTDSLNRSAVTGVFYTGTTSYFFIESTSGVSSPGVYSITATAAGVVSLQFRTMINIGIASAAFLYNGAPYFLAAYPAPSAVGISEFTSIQSTYFLMQSNIIPASNGAIIAKIAPQNGGGYANVGSGYGFGMLSNIPAIASGQYLFPYLYKDNLSSVNGDIYFTTGVNSAVVNLSPTSAPSDLIIANVLHLAGGVLQMYDGSNVTEHGFHLFPENLTASTSFTGVGGIGIGSSTAQVNQLQYCAVYEWADNKGQMYRSAPSPVATVNISSETFIPTTTFVGNLTVGNPTVTSVVFTGTPKVGQLVTDTTLAGHLTVGTYITAVGVNTVTLSNNALSNATGDAFSTGQLVNFTGTVTAGSYTITSVSSTAAALTMVGQVITDATTPGNLTAGTYITAASGSTLTLSSPALGSGTADHFSTKDVGTVTLQVFSLNATNKFPTTASPSSIVSIAFYRTTNNGSVFYRTSSVSSLTYNIYGSTYTGFTDTTPDHVLIGNEQLYTTGGVVENIGAPACSAVFQFKNRPVLIPSETQSQFWYGQAVIPGVPAEFSDVFVQNVDSRINRITAAQVLDDKIILFGPNNRFYVTGNGPTPSGANNDFTDATKIAGVSACENQNSIVEIPTGLIYQDPTRGIWMIDRSLQETFIGANVSQYLSSTVTSAQLFKDANKAVFTLSDGTTLSYDYYVNQWETDIYPLGAVDATVFDNKFTYVQSNGVVQKQTPAVYNDNGAVIPISFKTGWLNLAGVEGFQRIWELQIMGTWLSAHTLTVNFYKDFSTTVSQTVTIDATTDPGLYQYRIRLEQQKCTSLQIEIIESQSSAGEGVWFSSLLLKAGVKKGPYKLPAAVSY